MSPNQIELIVNLPDRWANDRDGLVPQLEQLKPLESLRGIYRFELLENGTQRLVWCFSNESDQPPLNFEFDEGCRKTRVTLKRYDEKTANCCWANSAVPSIDFLMDAGLK